MVKHQLPHFSCLFGKIGVVTPVSSSIHRWEVLSKSIATQKVRIFFYEACIWWSISFSTKTELRGVLFVCLFVGAHRRCMSCLRKLGVSWSCKKEGRKPQAVMKDDDKASQTSLFGRGRSFLDVRIDPCLEVMCLEVLKVREELKYISEGGFGFLMGILGWVGTVTWGILGHAWVQKEHCIAGDILFPRMGLT